MTQGHYDGTAMPPVPSGYGQPIVPTPEPLPPPPSLPSGWPPPPAGSHVQMTTPTTAEFAETPTTLAAPPSWRERWRKVTGAIGAGFAALWKLKILAVLAKLKFLTFFGSFAISLLAYGWLYGWQFGLGIVLLLMVHEGGHMLVFKARGAKVSLPTFVPFFGAYVKAAPRSVYDSALGGLAGPGIGALGALVALAIWNANDEPVYRAVAAFGFFINLINLAPIGILDGGNIWRAIRGKLSNGKGSQRIYAMSPDQRLVVGAIYVALIVVIGYATKLTYFTATFN